MDNKEFDELILKYGILDKAFDNIRLVDPINKKIIHDKGTTTQDHNLPCFAFWDSNKICDNCISLRAYHDNKTYVKMEYSLKDIYVMIAIPIDLPDRRVILEIIKNTTNSLILETDQGNIYSEVHELIDKMNNLALKDSLTGIYNRRYINEKLPTEITGAHLEGKDISIIMADIDFFKNVNDTYGHLCGDRTLKKFAKALSQCLSREVDWVARFGGEEFLICLPGVSNERAIEIAEKMRNKVENCTLECNQIKIKITSSFGVFTGTPQMKYSMNDMIKYADAKLYEAKHNGRNRVEA